MFSSVVEVILAIFESDIHRAPCSLLQPRRLVCLLRNFCILEHYGLLSISTLDGSATLILCFGIIVFAMSSISAFKEADPFLRPFDPMLIEMGKGNLIRTVPVGISNYSKTKSLRNCITRANQISDFASLTGLYREALKICRETARVAVRTSPTYAFAWCAGAYSSINMGEMEAFEFYDEKCRQTAPQESWLAIGRFNVAFAHLKRLTPHQIENLKNDVLVTLSSNNGRKQLAAEFVKSEEIRMFVSPLIGLATNEISKLFLWDVHLALLAVPKHDTNDIN